jgi:two-component system chemotaxis response regulator CheB
MQHFNGHVIGVILTGMGSDGMLGMSLLHGCGAHIIAEHESTCVVWGMPRSVVEAGAASAILPRPQIARAIESAVREMTR